MLKFVKINFYEDWVLNNAFDFGILLFEVYIYVNVYGFRLNSITIFVGPYKDTTLVMLALLL